MSLTKSLCLIAGAAVSLGSTALAQNSLDQTRASSHELLADAAGRTSALAQDARAFSVDVHGYTQFRYIWTSLDDDDLDDDNAIGFQTARTRISVSGNVINEDWGYMVQFGFDRDGGDAALLDAYGTYAMENGWNVMFGQFKLPFMREELVSSKEQLAWDRSVFNETFNQDRSQGIQFGYVAETTRFMAAFSDGIMTANTDYTSSAEADFAVTGRFEYKWQGAWEQFRDFTSFSNNDFAGMFGVAGHYQTGGETIGTSDVDMWAITADVSVEGNGWNVFGAATYVNTEPEGAEDRNDWGWMVQGGVFATAQLEVFGRFDMVLPDDDVEGPDDEFSTITAGINYYVVPESHTAKFTAGIIYFLDAPSDSIVPTSTLTPLLSSSEDGQFSILGQFQLVF